MNLRKYFVKLKVKISLLSLFITSTISSPEEFIVNFLDTSITSIYDNILTNNIRILFARNK